MPLSHSVSNSQLHATATPAWPHWPSDPSTSLAVLTPAGAHSDHLAPSQEQQGFLQDSQKQASSWCQLHVARPRAGRHKTEATQSTSDICKAT